MTEKQLNQIMYEVCDSLNVSLTHEESELIMHYSKAIKRKLKAGQHETIVTRLRNDAKEIKRKGFKDGEISKKMDLIRCLEVTANYLDG